jgi:predicted enzyme related to lactoylglutathione lyase
MPARKKISRPTKKKASPPKAKRPKAKRPTVARARNSKATKRPAASRKAAPPRHAARPTATKAAVPAAPPAPPAPPNAIGFVTQHIDYTTHDIDAVKRFYVETLGFAESEHDPEFNYLWIRTGRSSSLGFMPPVPGMGIPSPLKEPTLYVLVEDVDRAYAALSLKGVHFEGPPIDMPWGHRVVSTVDPEGRRLMLATPTHTNA